MGVIVSIDAESDKRRSIFRIVRKVLGNLYRRRLERTAAAYTTSIHKKNSSIRFFVVMVPKVMPDLMARNLLYTAVTRRAACVGRR